MLLPHVFEWRLLFHVSIHVLMPWLGSSRLAKRCQKPWAISGRLGMAHP
jgi:hypothetical protein